MIRRTTWSDIDQVMYIYGRAVQYMAQTGNPNQWVNGYPERGLIEQDIQQGISYVIEENGLIEAVFVYIEGEDPTYRVIENGAWMTDGRYGTIHRLASAGRVRGIAGQCFAWCANETAIHGCMSLRADTHMDNQIMQHLLLKNGFVYCGVIHLLNGSPRLAYERPVGNWSQPSGKGDGVAQGVTSMVLGIISLLLFCTCINWLTAIIAIIFGILQLTRNKEKSFAVVGIITSVLSMVLSAVLWIAVGLGISSLGMNYEEVYDSYYSDDYFGDEYYDDSYYEDDYYELFEAEDGQKFM